MRRSGALSYPKANVSFQMDNRINSILIGIITCCVVIPVKISFCSVIFADPEFQEYLPYIIKFVSWTSIAHQLTVTAYSRLPYAVGQMQDAGVVYLASMATSLASLCTSTTLISTTFITLSAATVLSGLVIIWATKLKLIRYIQYVPRSVIGGYLAYIGYYMGKSAITMMTNLALLSIRECLTLFTTSYILLWFPGATIACLMHYCLWRWKSPYTVSAILVSSSILFYSLMWIVDMSFIDARQLGLVGSSSTEGAIIHTYSELLVYTISLISHHFVNILIFVFSLFL
jgi:SulP family sulfate permease